MTSGEAKELNLFNATDTMAQFYEEIESFLSIMHREMEKLEYPTKAERLRPGTFTSKNLARRLLGSIMSIYVADDQAEGEDVEADTEDEEEDSSVGLTRKEIEISKDLKIPFTCVWLFDSKRTPKVDELKSPLLLSGQISEFSFTDKKSGEPAVPDRASLALSNLVQLSVKDIHRDGSIITMNCWRPKPMRKHKLVAKISRYLKQPLLQIDNQEKIRQVAQRIASEG